MLSRVANSIYWMSRYIERAENVARMVGVNLQLSMDLPAGAATEQWQPMIQVTGNDEDFAGRYEGSTRDDVLRFLTFDGENPDSIVSCLLHARENARTVREIISSEMWEEINRLYLFAYAPDAPGRLAESPHDFFREIIRSSHLIEGTKNETMPHSEAWHFTRLAKFLERADQTTRILDVKYFLLLPSPEDVGKPIDALQWAAVLRSTSALEAYRKRHGQVAAASIIDFLILDRDFPRAVHRCLNAAEDSLHLLTGTPRRRFSNPAERSLGRLVAELDYTEVADVIGGGFHQFVDHLQARINEIDLDVGATFFSLAR